MLARTGMFGMAAHSAGVFLSAFIAFILFISA
jgi:hypothetical protein